MTNNRIEFQLSQIIILLQTNYTGARRGDKLYAEKLIN